MKYIKITILLGIFILLCSCKSQAVIMADNISPKIIKAHNQENVDISNLSKKEKALFDDFMFSQKKENKVINISECVNFSVDSYSEYDTPRMYYDNGEYFIKYTDINWEKVEGDYRASIDLNRKGSALFKSLVPILYEETHDNPKYLYRYYAKKISDKHLDYYYKSISDNSGLIIRYHLSKKKINNISLIYQDLFYYVGDEENSKSSSISFSIFLAITFAGLFIAGVIFLFKKFRK